MRDVAEWTEDLPWRMSATWAGPDGRPRQGQVLLPRPAIPGDTVAIWVDDEGRRTSEPRPLVEVLSAAVAAGALTFVCGATLALLGHLLVRRVLWPYRSREWEQDWASVEPRWTDRA